jgi:serine/threonine-protein kinase RsbW
MHAARQTLVVRNELSELSRVRDWVDQWTRQHRLPDALAQILDLCTAEVVTNIISYGYDDHGVHPISLSLEMQDDLISLEIEDEGKPFDPVENQPQETRKTLDQGRVGGWGLRIVRHFSEGLCYRRAEARNLLRVIFRHPGRMPH